MKISIALCTYNGEKFLPEQLASYAAQSRLPDEVVVCDDGSTDSTREILREFAETVSFPVRIHDNEKNLGYVQNFGYAANLCTGDIIIFSDQDDVWHQDKLEIIETEFGKSEDVGVVYADAEVVDENLQPHGLTMWQCNNLDGEKQAKIRAGKSLEHLLRDGYVLGSSMAFRAKFKELVLPVPTGIYYDHDDWITLLISASAKVVLIAEPLIEYRQHSHQTSAGMKLSRAAGAKVWLDAQQRTNQYEKVLNQLEVAEKRLSGSVYANQSALAKIKAAHRHYSTRASLSGNILSRSWKVGRELIAGNYHVFASGFRSAGKDLLKGGR